ncbi:substrate-binding domain-containing protein [Williamsia sp. CHRR-6]|uniref:substrate-binding domain-containing protein n=1 Tax=Williamsia sp. CHRR-6 TaxID=2835871 RepID=UPI001BDA0FA8|nr:substrate-binding domain-containing protein [Williamsia sp. CHRR-6]MBT0565684.1 substrate-binding domain-containing protein [Williamsia sp. CHRR-6]
MDTTTPWTSPGRIGRSRAWRRTVVGTSVTAAIVLAVAGCSSTGGKKATQSQATGKNYTIAMVTHGAPGDTFWDLIRKGAQAAAAKDNITLKYSSKNSGPDQATLVQSAIDSKVDGLAVTMSFADAIAPTITSAVKAGIPTVVFNGGINAWKPTGALAYFGQDEKISGKAAGERLASEGAKKVICIVHEQGSVALEDRCAGVRDGLLAGSGSTPAAPGAGVENLNVAGTDIPSVESAITAKLQQDPSIDHIIALGAPFALTAVKSVSAAGSKAKVATFDTNSELVGAIENGSVEWAIDQQPYLQGYLAVDSLWLYLTNRNTMGGGQPSLTGPSFIDKSNIAAIAEYAKRGTR